MESITYDDALKYYYEFKQKYYKKYNSRKAKIINDTNMSKRQKQNKIKGIKMPCISCKNPYGTTFEDKDRTLIAVCGNQQTPCKLNIRLKKSSTILTEEYIPTLLNIRESLEVDMIRLKLSFLFGFIDEDELTGIFDDIKLKMGENNDLIKLVDEFREASMDMTNRKEQIKLLNVEKYNTIKDIKGMIQEFMTTKNTELIKDAVNMNIEDLSEILEKIRVNKYREMYVETVNGNDIITELIQNVNSIQDKEFETSEGQVLQYVI